MAECCACVRVSASDPAENPYWKRDVRRAFPKLSVVTQPELSAFLLQTPENPACVPLPKYPRASVLIRNDSPSKSNPRSRLKACGYLHRNRC